MNKPTIKTESTTQLFYREVSAVSQKLTSAKTIKDYLKILKGIEDEINMLVQLNESHLRLMASKTVVAQPESHTARLLRRASTEYVEPVRPKRTLARLLAPPTVAPAFQSFSDKLMRDLHITTAAVVLPDTDDDGTGAGYGQSITSSVTLIVQDRDVAPVNTGSPLAKGADRPTFVKIPTTEELSRNYNVISELHEKSRSLDEMASSLEVQFASGRGLDKTADKTSVAKIQKEIQNIRTQVDRALAKAATYLTEVATAHAPEKVILLTRALAKILERGMVYKTVQTYLYVFPNEYESSKEGSSVKDTAFTFCQYYWLKGLTDREGKRFPQLFVVLSCTPSPNTGMNFKLNTLTDMVPPSPKMLGKAFVYNNPTDARNLARTLGMQLDIDRVANEYGRIPIATLLRKTALVKESFSVEKSVHELKVDNKSVTFTFIDAVNTEEKAAALTAQLSIELQAWARSTKARLRQITQQATNGLWQAVFYYTRSVGFSVSVEDLEFLKDRLDLDDPTIDSIVDTINKN